MMVGKLTNGKENLEKDDTFRQMEKREEVNKIYQLKEEQRQKLTKYDKKV